MNLAEKKKYVNSIKRAIKEYFRKVTPEQFEKDFDEVSKMPSSKCKIKLF